MADQEEKPSIVRTHILALLAHAEDELDMLDMQGAADEAGTREGEQKS